MKMLVSFKRSILFGLFVLVALSACKKDDDIDCPDGQVQHGDHCEDDNELITTLRLVFKNGSSEMSFQYRDTDGIGGQSATIDTILLDKDLSYDVSLVILNESVNPAEDVGEEIVEEGHQHQFFFTPDKALNLTTTYNDKDKNEKPIGMKNIFKTGDASKGNLLVRLKHQPNGKDGSESTGATDIEVTFYTEIN